MFTHNLAKAVERYGNIVREYGPHSDEAVRFRRRYRDDANLMSFCRAIDVLWREVMTRAWEGDPGLGKGR